MSLAAVHTSPLPTYDFGYNGHVHRLPTPKLSSQKELHTQNVVDAFAACSSAVTLQMVQIWLLGNRQATTIRSNTDSYISENGVLQHIAQEMPDLEEFSLNTSYPLKNEIRDADLTYLISKRSNIKVLNLQGDSNLTWVSLVKVGECLKKLTTLSAQIEDDTNPEDIAEVCDALNTLPMLSSLHCKFHLGNGLYTEVDLNTLKAGLDTRV